MKQLRDEIVSERGSRSIRTYSRGVAQRAVWTDDRLDDKPSSVDATFERIDLSLRELRAEQLSMRAELADEIRSSRAEHAAAIEGVRVA